MFTVESLRKSGYRVRVFHDRAFLLVSKYQPSRVLGQGRTLVDVTTPGGKSYTGVSYVLLRDKYCRRLGVKIALGRALKGLGIPRKNRKMVSAL